LDEAVGNVGGRVEEDGEEEDARSAHFVAQDPPENASEQESKHLHVDDEQAGIKNVFQA